MTESKYHEKCNCLPAAAAGRRKSSGKLDGEEKLFVAHTTQMNGERIPGAAT